MSAQNSPRRGIISAAAGLLGFSVLAGLLVTVMVAPAVAVTGVTASSAIGVFDSLPDYMVIGHQAERNTIYAVSNAEGNENGYVPIATIYDQNREEVSFENISKFATEAAVDGEDRRFFDHGGVDVASVIRASVGNVVHNGIDSGSSTLSMQLVKNIFVQQALQEPTPAAQKKAYAEATALTFDRKLKEMKLAIGLEKQYTKKEILTAYLNIAFFADNTYGIQAAAQRYYSVSAKDLTLPEAASLIAIVQYPGERGLDDPKNYKANQARRDVILDSMLQAGDITQKEHDEAIATPVDETTIHPSAPTNSCMGANPYAKWWCDFIVKNVKNFTELGATEQERLANWKTGGYKLYTTLDLDVQTQAQNATWNFAPNTETAFSLGSATSTVQAGTGRILVMTENKEFNDTLEGGGSAATAVNFNTSHDYGGSNGFQSGSTYKLFTLLNWLEHGKGLNEKVLADGRTVQQSQFKDTCADGGGWGGPYPFGNASGETGIWSILNGTINSVNGVFISMGLQLDLCDTRHIAEALGVQRGDQTHLLSNPSSILGTNEITPLSLASAYAAIGANGLWCQPIMLDRVVDPDGKELPGQEKNCRQAVPQDVAATALYALSQVVQQGTGSLSDPGDGIPLGGKTGTTDQNNQTWFASVTTAAASAVWVGNIIDKYNMFNYEAGGVSGAYLRHAISRPTIAAINSKYPGGAFPEPSDALLSGAGTEVPNVVGQTPEAAKALLVGLGFEVADGGPVDSEVPAGKVASTDPAPGSQSGKGAKVTIYTSKGNKIGVPDESGKTSNDAHADLLAKGFTNVSAQDSCAPLTPPIVLPNDPREGKVVSQTPGGGSFALPTDPIKLTVGKAVCAP